MKTAFYGEPILEPIPCERYFGNLNYAIVSRQSGLIIATFEVLATAEEFIEFFQKKHSLYHKDNLPVIFDTETGKVVG